MTVQGKAPLRCCGMSLEFSHNKKSSTACLAPPCPLPPYIDEICRYHYLNHFAIFGGGYRGGAMSIMSKLIAKYGN